MQRLSLAFALAAFCVSTAGRAAPPPEPPIPACDAPDGASSVERQYQTMTMSPFVKGALKIGPVKDLGVFPPPKASGQYATAEMFVKAVRYCEAVVTLPDGSTDPTYWTIPLTFNVNRWIVQSTFCSQKHDFRQSGCAAYRPEGVAPAK